MIKLEELPAEFDLKPLGELPLHKDQQLWVCVVDRSIRSLKIGWFLQLHKYPISRSWEMSRKRSER
jgi:hypothetical protein